MEITVLIKLARFADGQFGQVTREQALRAGAQVDELIDSGLAEWLTGDVLRLRAGGQATHPQLYAAWLQLAPATAAWERSPPADGVLSHETALELYGVGGEGGAQVEFTVPDTARFDVRAPTVLHAAPVGDGDWMQVDGIPVTAPGRTLIDLDQRYDIDELARMAASMVSLRWATPPALRTALARGLERTPVRGDHRQWLTGVLAEVGS